MALIKSLDEFKVVEHPLQTKAPRNVILEHLQQKLRTEHWFGADGDEAYEAWSTAITDFGLDIEHNSHSDNFNLERRHELISIGSSPYVFCLEDSFFPILKFISRFLMKDTYTSTDLICIIGDAYAIYKSGIKRINKASIYCIYLRCLKKHKGLPWLEKHDLYETITDQCNCTLPHDHFGSCEYCHEDTCSCSKECLTQCLEALVEIGILKHFHGEGYAFRW